jgi:protein TonB
MYSIALLHLLDKAIAMTTSHHHLHLLDDIVFEGRNKAYGAYHLRHVYDRHMARAMMVSVLFMLLAVNAPRIINWIKGYGPAEEPVLTMTPVVLSDPSPVIQVKPTPPPPKEAKPQPVKPQIAFVPPVVVNDTDETAETNTPPTVEQLEQNITGTENTGGEGDGVDPTLQGTGTSASTTIEVETPDDEPLAFVEQMPAFPGGMEAMYAFINSKIKYTVTARENRISGQVVVQFVVTKEGNIEHTRIIRSLGGGLDEEAIRVIMSMPRWTPGKHNGRTVPVMFTLPIKFVLQ